MRLRSLSWREWFWVAWFAALAVKFAVAWRLPLLGDEAYYVLWGKHFDLGYYDQPPMIGWVEHLLLIFSANRVWLRLPSILTPLVVAPLLVRLARELGFEKTRAYWAGLLYLIVPAHLAPVVVAPEAPLILFSFLGTYFLALGLKPGCRSPRLFSLCAGGFLGLAFLSKYFVLLLALGMLGYGAFSSEKRERIWRRAALVFAGALPFALIHLGWNATHCWANVVFNTVGRNAEENFDLRKLAVFLAYQLYLASPVLVFFLLKAGRGGWRRIVRGRLTLFVWLFALPLGVFALTALKYAQGMHWALSFYPYYFLLVAAALRGGDLKRSAAVMGALTAVQLAVLGWAFAQPLEHWRGEPFYRGLTIFSRADELARQVARFKEQPNTVVVSDNYTVASLVNAVSPYYLPVLDEPSKFGHEDDFITDFRALNGKRIVLVTDKNRMPSTLAPYLTDVRRDTFQLGDQTLFLYFGSGFSYPRYRSAVLERVRATWYAPPAWLPKAGCPFVDRYF